MILTQDTPFSPATPVRELQTDVSCRKCAYNLRGLSSDSKCPECGTLVSLSTHGDLLSFCDPTWVSDLGTGIWCILWGMLMIVFGVIAGVMIKVQHIGVDLSMAATIFSAGASILHLYGAWLLTAPDPSGLGEDRYGLSRKMIRITLVIGMLQHAVSLVTMSGTLPPTLFFATIGLGLASTLTSLVGILAMLNYLAKLACRIPDPQLAAVAEHLMWEIGIPLGILAFLAVLSLASGVFAVFGCFILPGAVALLIVGARYLIFLTALGISIGEQAARARQAWTSPNPN